MHTDILLDRIQEILREVGETLLAMRTKGLLPGTWHGTQLKSESDLIAEKLILGRVCALTPSLPVISEEDVSSQTIGGLDRYWLVDPIDGTASFCGGYTGFVTQIALMDCAQPILGAVYAPALDLMYVAEHGAGANINGAMLSVNKQRCSTVITDNYPEPSGIAKLLYEQLPCTDYLESGSIGLKICHVASGRADLFVKDVAVQGWDLAPGQLILQEAGGVLKDLSGNDIDYKGLMEKKGGLVAAKSSSLASKVIKFLAEKTESNA